MEKTMGELFAGIGGFSLGAHWAGWESKWAVEINPDKQKVFQHNHPTTRIHSDIKTFRDEEEVTVITCGFPCTDISRAKSNAQGLQGPASSLFYEACEVFRLFRPAIIILENSPAILNRGLPDVLRELSLLGYDAEWKNICLHSFGLPTIRRRWICIAYTNRVGRLLHQSGAQFFGRELEKKVQQEAEQAAHLVAQTFRIGSLQNRDDTICQLSNYDNGISQQLLSMEAKFIGDAFSPVLSFHIFNTINHLINFHP